MTDSGTSRTPRTAGEMAALARAFLERKGVESARLESELLVAHALGLTRLKLFLELDRPITPAEVDRARDLLVRRGKREPAAYILGEREFFGRAFRVGPGVLVPRPETEHIVDRAREIARERAREGRALRRAADLGTGSGCLAITLALEIEGLDVLAVDVSSSALEIARGNALRLGAERVRFAPGEGFDLLVREAEGPAGKFDLVVSNPPYVARSERATLAPEVREHEPEVALFAPEGDPDHFARRFLELAPRLVAMGGKVLVELGHDQAPRVRALAESRAVRVRFYRDYAGHERVLEIEAGGG